MGVMKLITAVVRPFSVDAIKDALDAIGIKGMTVVDAKGFGAQGGHTQTYRGSEYKVSFLPKEKIEVVVSDELLDKAIEAIISKARTDNMGDGKIWVSDVSRVVRVRTGEEGQDAV